jgi:Arc/MetJ-type ribon-helix-helix transcriptional regulator
MAGAEGISLELSADEAELVRAALRLLLDAEDDPDTIRQLKALLARLAA